MAANKAFRSDLSLNVAAVETALAPTRTQSASLGRTSRSLEGWMDEDAAAAAGQLLGGRPGLLVVDHRELLSATARVVGSEFGELHFKVWMALITLHVAHGMPEDGVGSTSVGELSRLLWGKAAKVNKNSGDTERILGALLDLRRTVLTLPGWNHATQSAEAGMGDTNLLIKLWIDETLLKSMKRRDKGDSTDRVEVGANFGGRGNDTISWRLDPEYVSRLADTELRRFDWSKAQQIRRTAFTLWMTFSSTRMPFMPVPGSAHLEYLDVPLTVEHCHALGVTAGQDAARRRTFNDAGPRVCEADSRFVSIDALGGRGMESYLRVVRQRASLPQLERASAAVAASGQLSMV